MQPGLGAQLSRRVSEGSITQGRAQKTAGERRTLEDAYGDAWRKRISGGEDLQDLRIQASQGDESAQTALTKAMTRRKNLLAKAQSIGKAMPAVGKQSSRKKPLPPGLKKKTGWSPY